MSDLVRYLKEQKDGKKKASPLPSPMSVIVNDRISTSFAYNRVEGVADFDVEALVRTHSAGLRSQTSSIASTTARETRRIISRSEPCFVTKRLSYTLERVHWVNAVRKDPGLKLAIVSPCHSTHVYLIPSEQENFLKSLHIVHMNFNLNDTSNLTHRKSFVSTLPLD